MKIFHITIKGSLNHYKKNEGVKKSYLSSFCSKWFETENRFLLDVLEVPLFTSARICKICIAGSSAYFDKYDSFPQELYPYPDFGFLDRDTLAIFKLLSTQSFLIEELGDTNERKIISK